MQKLRTRILQTVFINLCAATLALGCGESGTEAGSVTKSSGLECSGEPQPLPTLADGSAISADDAGLPFFGGAVTYANIDAGSSAKLSIPELGTVCMSGSLVDGDDWGADMILSLAARANYGEKMVSLFDAGALGIEALKFRLDPPEGGRMKLAAEVVMKCDCPDDPFGCVAGGRYTLATPDHTAPARFTEPTTVTAKLADFLPHDLAEPLEGTDRLAEFLLQLEAPQQALDYEFCVSDVEFLDGEGNPVVPEE